MAAVYLLAALLAAALCSGSLQASQLPSANIILPNDAVSLAVGAQRMPACGSGSSALIVVRNVLLDQHGTQLCVALSALDGSTAVEFHVADQSVQNNAELCLPPEIKSDISPALSASSALLVPFRVSPSGEFGQDLIRTLQLHAVLRGPAGASMAETTARFTVLLQSGQDTTGSRGCVGQQRFDDVAEVAGLYRIATTRADPDTMAQAATGIADAVPQSGRIAAVAASACLRAARPHFLAPQWCSMLRHPGCIESEFAPESLPPSPYNTTAELAHAWNRRLSLLTTAIGRGRVALTHDGGHWSSTVTVEELAVLERGLTHAQTALLDAQFVSSVLTHTALSTAAPPPPLLAIVFMTMRPGGYDVLLSSLAAQTDVRYELFCVDELAPARRSAVAARAAALGVNLVGLKPGKARPISPRRAGAEAQAADTDESQWRFGYANAINTGLLGIADRHAGELASIARHWIAASLEHPLLVVCLSTVRLNRFVVFAASGTAPPTAVTVLQDFIWLPPDFVANTLSFYNGTGGLQRPSFVSYPRRIYSAPVHVLDTGALAYKKGSNEPDTAAPLSVFEQPLTSSPADMGWPPAPPAWDSLLAEGSNKATAGERAAAPSFYWECFACTAPWGAILALNGVDERLDETGDDCHERNLSERARLLGYDIRLLQSTPVFDIDHRGFVGAKDLEDPSAAPAALEVKGHEAHDPVWDRSESNTNVAHWGKLLSKIVDMVEPIRSGVSGSAANPFELWRGNIEVAQKEVQQIVSQQDDIGGDGRATIALIMPITSIVKDCLTCDSYANTNIDTMLLFTVLMDSFVRSVDWETEGREFQFAFYCSYDPGDAVFDDPVLRTAVETKADAVLSKHGAKLVLVKVVRNANQLEWGNIMPLWNAVAERALHDGADYFYLVNDDLELTTAGWATVLTGMLRSNPLLTNFGVAAGVGYEAEEARNATHGNFPMVHRTHLEIFGSLYPATFSNWYADPWLCDIYQAFGSFFHADYAGVALPSSMQSIRVIDRQPYRYIRNNIIPDGWFDYPDATNTARRTLQTWLGQQAPSSATVVLCPEGLSFCRPVPVAGLDIRWCLSPRDGRFFGDRGDHKLSCKHDLWHPRLECWVPGRDSEVDFTGQRRQDSTAKHVGEICTAEALVQDAQQEELARAAAASRRMDFTIPEGAKVGQTLRTTDPSGRPISFVLPAGVSPGQIVTLDL